MRLWRYEFGFFHKNCAIDERQTAVVSRTTERHVNGPVGRPVSDVGGLPDGDSLTRSDDEAGRWPQDLRNKRRYVLRTTPYRGNRFELRYTRTLHCRPQVLNMSQMYQEMTSDDTPYGTVGLRARARPEVRIAAKLRRTISCTSEEHASRARSSGGFMVVPNENS
ncbi:hypothetical protein EVAR_52825_1 [Eumeta japonica]|uniref:Uncharacterized protein n=1 Tax=Eumeta variegata TaxID=151549 RepID=A0A4C1YF54_EUMVA|nr:hypothetical protein EVAR_52825_1 [Eumeta japonica]